MFMCASPSSPPLAADHTGAPAPASGEDETGLAPYAPSAWRRGATSEAAAADSTSCEDVPGGAASAGEVLVVGGRDGIACASHDAVSAGVSARSNMVSSFSSPSSTYFSTSSSSRLLSCGGGGGPGAPAASPPKDSAVVLCVGTLAGAAFRGQWWAKSRSASTDLSNTCTINTIRTKSTRFLNANGSVAVAGATVVAIATGRSTRLEHARLPATEVRIYKTPYTVQRKIFMA